MHSYTASFFVYFLRMATKDHFAGYTKYFGNIFANLSPEGTTEEQIKEVYNEWASRFDEVITYNYELRGDIVRYSFKVLNLLNRFNLTLGFQNLLKVLPLNQI